MTPFEMYKRLQQIDTDMNEAHVALDGDLATDLSIEKGELEAALMAVDYEQAGQDERMVEMITGVLKRTIEPTGKPGQFEITNHFIFEGKPAKDQHFVYDSPGCDAYADHVERVTRYDFSEEFEYIGPQTLEIDGKTYFVPKFHNTND